MTGLMIAHLEDSITAFGRFLRQAGLEIGTSDILNAIRAVEEVGIKRKDDFYTALQSSLITTHKKIELFNDAFELFWRNPNKLENMSDMIRKLYESRLAKAELESMHRQRALHLKQFESLQKKSNVDVNEYLQSDEIRLLMYSEDEILKEKDFAQYTDEEIQKAKTMLERFDWDFGQRANRRMKAGKKPYQLDFRRTFRKNVFPDQDFIRLMWLEKKTKPRPLVMLCDVSASMDNYTRMLLHFMHTFSGLDRRVEAFIFGTRLTRITKYFKERDVDTAVQNLSAIVQDWGGGTRIGEALEYFNFHWARRVLNQGAVVIVISDGWDTGNTSILNREMNRLHKSSHRLIWLNPNLGYTEYQPLTEGIKTILPHVDDFLPVHNLNSLLDLGRLLSNLDHHAKTNFAYKNMAMS